MAPPPHPAAAAPADARCGPLQLLRWRFAELLEDFHVWGALHSRPSGRGLPLTPRLGVTFTVLCAHACLAALVTAAGPEQVGGFSLWGARTPGPQRGPLPTQEALDSLHGERLQRQGPHVREAGVTGPGGVCGTAGSASADRHRVGARARHHGAWLSRGVGSPGPSKNVSVLKGW